MRGRGLELTEATTTQARLTGVLAWPRWVFRLVASVQAMVIGVGGGLMFAGSAAMVDDWSKVPILPAIPGVLFGWMAVIAIHEMGHFIVARWVGMTPYSVGVAGVYSWASSDGWRIRFRRMPAGAGGFVMSHFDADQPFRQQMLPMLLGGAMANLLCGALLGLVGIGFWWSGAGVYLCALALFSVCVGVANLLPTRGKSIGSDGFQWLQWLRNDELAPVLALRRLNALSLKGIPAEQLPADCLDALSGIPVVGSALPHWFKLCALRNTGAWADAARIGPEFERAIECLPAATARALSIFVQQMRTEIAFCEAMASEQDKGEICRHIDRSLDWHLPALRPRCRALEAALRGDIERMHAGLRESERKMRKTFDIAYRNSEANLRRSIMDVARKTGSPSLPG